MKRILLTLISLIYLVNGQDFKEKLSCPHCGINRMDKEFLRQLNLLDIECSFNLYITSGYRCEKRNRDVGGESNSRHLDGLAVDIRVYNSDNIEEIKTLAKKSGYFSRVYDEGDHIHIEAGDDSFAFRKLHDGYKDEDIELYLSNSLFFGRGIKYQSSEFLRVGYFITDGYELDNYYLYFDKLNNSTGLSNNQISFGASWESYWDGPYYYGINLSLGKGELSNTKYSFIEPSINIGYLFQYLDLQLNLGYTITTPSKINTSDNNIGGLHFTAIANLGIYKN